MVRNQMFGIDSDIFDVLDSKDVVGDLVFTKNDELYEIDNIEISSNEIANEIKNVKDNPTWFGSSNINNFSLAGTQGKFTLSKVGDKWYKPNAYLPSTHIFKPETITDSNKVEFLCNRLSKECEINTSDGDILEFDSQTVYVVKRFDRKIVDGEIVRLQQEDLLQAMGLPPESKYDVSIDHCVNLFRSIERDDLAKDFMRQLAFNTYIGNSDAHAKNYSILEGENLSTMYDVLMTRYWKGFNTGLATPLTDDDYSGFPETIGENHIIEMAKRNKLDPEEILTIFRETESSITENIYNIDIEEEFKEDSECVQ